MDNSINNSDRQFLADLHRIGSATVHQLCDQEGVTATAIRQRLIRLQASGYVSRETIRKSRGRPHHEYQITEQGQKILGDNYVELATILWKQLNSIEDAEVRSKILSHLEEALIQRYGSSNDGDSPQERLLQLQETLSEHGFNTEIGEKNGQMVLMERNCPYHELACQDRTICDMEHQVFEKIVGVPLQLTQRCVDGHNCCMFETSISN